MTPSVFQTNFEKDLNRISFSVLFKNKKAETSSALYQSVVNRFIQ